MGTKYILCFRQFSIALHGLERHKVFPDVIDTVPPELADIAYPNGIKVKIGDELKPQQVREAPIIKWTANDNELYTLCLTDPDAPSRINPIYREWHHWLVGNIPGNSIENGHTLTEYVGAGPPKGTGLHRYVFLVFKQKGKVEFSEQRLKNTQAAFRKNFSVRNFAHKYKLGQPIAGNFFQAQYDNYVPVLYTQLKLKMK